MSDFFARFDKISTEAKATSDGKAFVAAGFDVYNTGGNCLAWSHDVEGSAGWQILVTDSDGTGLAVDAGEPWLVGAHGPNCEYTESHSEAATVADAIRLARAHAAAVRFAAILRRDLSAEQFADMQIRNITYGEGVCASHDFCDANMAMLEAVSPFIPEWDPASADHAEFWNLAWNIAKREYLTSPRNVQPSAIAETAAEPSTAAEPIAEPSARDVIAMAERALSEGQFAAAGNDATSGDNAEPNTVYFDALKACRTYLGK